MSNQRKVKKVINRKQHDQKLLQFVELVTKRLEELGAEISSLQEVMEEWTARVEVLESRLTEKYYPSLCSTVGCGEVVEYPELGLCGDCYPKPERSCEGIEGPGLTIDPKNRI